MNFSGRDVFSNEEFDHNALFHAPRYLLFAYHSSNSQTGLNRWRLWLHSLKVAQLLRSAACLQTNQSRSYLNHLVQLNLFLERDAVLVVIHSTNNLVHHQKGVKIY